MGTGERSEKIRTYNFPQSRVTDHRAGVTLHKLDTILEGELDEGQTFHNFYEETKFQAELLARTYYESQGKPIYVIREIRQSEPSADPPALAAVR